MWTVTAIGVGGCGKLQMATENTREQFPSVQLQTLRERGQVCRGQPSRQPSQPRLKDRAQVSPCTRDRQTDEVPTQKAIVSERFELELYREENSAPIFTFYNVHLLSIANCLKVASRF